MTHCKFWSCSDESSTIACTVFIHLMHQKAFNEVTLRPYAVAPCFTAPFCSGMTAVGLTSLPSPGKCAVDVIQVASIYRLRHIFLILWDLALPDVSIGQGVCGNVNCLCRVVPK